MEENYLPCGRAVLYLELEKCIMSCYSSTCALIVHIFIL